jgi:hypothetical protein
VKHQKLLARLLPQHPVFQTEFVVRDFDLLHVWQINRVKFTPHVARCIVPEHYPVLVEEQLKTRFDTV